MWCSDYYVLEHVDAARCIVLVAGKVVGMYTVADDRFIEDGVIEAF